MRITGESANLLRLNFTKEQTGRIVASITAPKDAAAAAARPSPLVPLGTLLYGHTGY